MQGTIEEAIHAQCMQKHRAASGGEGVDGGSGGGEGDDGWYEEALRIIREDGAIREMAAASKSKMEI